MSNPFRTLHRAMAAVGLGALALMAQAQEVPPEVKEALKRADEAVAKIVAVPASQRTFDNTVGALDDLSTRLESETNLALFMQNVSTSEKEREDSRAAEEAVSEWGIAVGKREDLYQAIKAYADTKPNLQGEQKRLLEFILRDYRRAGMDLPVEKRERLKAIEIELQKLATDFQKNIYEDETVAFMSEKELKGLPDDLKKSLKKTSGDLYIVTMDGPTFNAVMDYVEDGEARKKAWFAFKRRGGQRNVRLLERILALRAEASSMLGYKNTVDYEVETRMAKNSETIAKFYADLRPIVRTKAKQDYDQFLAEKRAYTKDRNAKLYPWDQSFYKKRLLKTKYAVDSQKVAEYFPVTQVFDGLFQITSSIYGIQFKDATADAPKLGLPVWHPDAKLWAVSDKQSGELLGHIYTDLYPRENKYNHAACWGLKPRKVWADGTVQKPLAALVCNFTKPTADKPSLMTHDEVETFFHEFGHGLHQLLTETKYGRFSGTAVARDFVEAPSQMFENWVWSPEVLSKFAKHYKTGEVLPLKTLKAMNDARTLGSGLEAEHQFYYGLVDQAYHLAPEGKIDTTKVGVDLLGQVELYEPPVGTFFQSSFGHLMGYQGAYYGYQWSLVYAQDMFTKFDQKGPLNPEVGMEYRKKVLARGGSIDETEMLRDFLGRDPNMDAYLKSLGLSPRK
jgi:thimet oligopeptidase